MNPALFSDENENRIFCDFQSNKTIRSIEARDAGFYDEIDDLIAKCTEIFEKYNSEINYAKEIYEIGLEHSNQGSSSDINEYDLRIDSIYKRYEQFLLTLPLEVKEDLEFNMGKIKDRLSRVREDIKTAKKTAELFPNHTKFSDPEERKKVPIIIQIKKYLHPEENTIEEQVEEPLPYVERISVAPKALSNDSGEIVMDNIEPAPDSFEHAEGFFSDETQAKFDDPLFYDVNYSHDFDEVKEPEVVPLDSITPKEEENKEEIVTFTLDGEQSLADISAAVCGDENYWFDIYSANKEIIDERLEESGVSNESPFENDPTILEGLTIVIPNSYQKTEESMKLVA